MEIQRKLASIQEVAEIKPIEGADRIEAVRINGWWVVSQKGYKVGDKVIYFEIDSFLPVDSNFDFLLKGSSPKKMFSNGKEISGIRLKTIRLKGTLSQGLIMPLDIVRDNSPYFKRLVGEGEIGYDVSDIIGVVKYEAPIPACLVGKAKGSFPSFIPKTDEERIQNISEIFNSYYVSEKLDGTSTTFYKKDGVFGVCTRNLELVEGDTLQWRIARGYDLENKLPDGIAIQGELIGEGIQKNPLKRIGNDIYIFNVYNILSGKYLNYDEFVSFCQRLGLKTVPIIDENFALPKSVDEMLAYANGKSLLNCDYEREGVVVRPKKEMQIGQSRFSFKAISNDYLLKYEE